MHHRRPLIPASVAAVAAVALLAAGCGGGGSSPNVANVASSTAATTTATATQSGPVGFTRCMRSNGVQNFPDPPAAGARIAKPTPQQLGVSTSRFDAAVSACHRLLPNAGGEQQQTAQQKHTQLIDELSFARCMRNHGLGRFPDPTAEGQLSVEMVQAQGINVHAPAVLRVVQTCLPASHGALTAAKVREALNNAGH